MQPVQYIILDKTLNMSVGKAAAQAAHASVEGIRLNAKEEWGNPWDEKLVNLWYRGGHYAKVVLETTNLHAAQTYLENRGIKTTMIVDEGRTEFEAELTPTALALPVVDKDIPHVRETFSCFDLYRDWWNSPSARPPSLIIESPKRLKWRRSKP
jgi:peptidyl-tRNA hydrolase